MCVAGGSTSLVSNAALWLANQKPFWHRARKSKRRVEPKVNLGQQATSHASLLPDEVEVRIFRLALPVLVRAKQPECDSARRAEKYLRFCPLVE